MLFNTLFLFHGTAYFTHSLAAPTVPDELIIVELPLTLTNWHLRLERKLQGLNPVLRSSLLSVVCWEMAGSMCVRSRPAISFPATIQDSLRMLPSGLALEVLGLAAENITLTRIAPAFRSSFSFCVWRPLPADAYALHLRQSGFPSSHVTSDKYTSHTLRSLRLIRCTINGLRSMAYCLPITLSAPALEGTRSQSCS